ncbi:hypothetical protein Tco_0026795 [Tanacetum coccineum]
MIYENLNPRPKDYPFKDWLLTKVGHTNVSEPVKKTLLKSWLIDCFRDDVIKDLRVRSFDDYKWMFDLEIDQLADEYELGVGKKGHMLEDIWKNYKKVQGDNTFWWHDQKSEEEERRQLGIDIKEYDPPMVHVETFEVKRYSFDTGQNFICVTEELMDALPLGRENGARFRDMIRKEVDSGRRIRRKTYYYGVKFERLETNLKDLGSLYKEMEFKVALIRIHVGKMRACALRNIDLEVMELENTQNNALAKLPMLKLGEYEMWEIRIKQYFQIQDYALWEVIENGNSWVIFLVNNSGKDVVIKKNDVRPESPYAHAMPNEHQLTFDQLQRLVSRLEILGVVTLPEDLNVKFLRSLPAEWDTHVVKKSVGTSINDKNLAFLTASGASSTNNINTINHEVIHEDLEQLHDDDLEEMDLKWNMALLSTRARNFYQRTGKKIITDGSNIVFGMVLDLIGVTWQRKKIRPKHGFMAFSDSEYDDLLVKLDDTGFKASTYKIGLSILERQVLKYKEHEVLFSEEIALLKRSVGHKDYQMGLLRTEFEKVKLEKEGFEFKIAKFEKISKRLRSVASKPTPLELSYSSLEEFKQPEVNKYGPRDSSLKPTTGYDKESDNSKENTDDSLKQQQKTDSKTSSVKSPLKVDKDWKEKFFCPANQVREEEPKKDRENNVAPIIEDWVSDDEPIPKVEKKTIIPTTTKKEFVKPEKPVRRSVSFDHIQYCCPNQQRKRIVSGNNYNKKDNDYYSRTSHPSAHKHMAPRAVLMKTGLKFVNTVRPIRSVNIGRPFSAARSFNTVRPSYTAYPKSTNHCARPRTYFQNQAQSSVHRPFYKRTAITNSMLVGDHQNPMVHTGFQTNINYIDARGRSKSVIAWVPKEN